MISFFPSGIICLISFLIALCFTLGSGSYWIDIFDRYAGSVPLLVIAFFEVIGVTYIYKIKRYVGKRLNIFIVRHKCSSGCSNFGPDLISFGAG